MDNHRRKVLSHGPILNLYPDSVGGTLAQAVKLLQKEELRGAFSSAYLLPSLYNTDLDRGFSVIDYGLNEQLARPEDLKALADLGIDLKLDFLLNHASVLCPQFQDILIKGDGSPYRDFFIDWNRFWEGHGEMTAEGYIQPDEALLKEMFFRKPGLPILMVRFPDGRSVPYWNTFYQEIQYPRVDAQDVMRLCGAQYGTAQALVALVNQSLEEGTAPDAICFGGLGKYRGPIVEYLESNRKYLGQMDLNITSPLVWEYYDRTLKTLAGYGASVVRLDAFAYAPKSPGKRNFLNEPETSNLLDRVGELAEPYGLSLLPEIHASYMEKTYERLAGAGYLCYDFFLPGLVIDALERGDGKLLEKWALELRDRKIRTVNMLGCHDGIPLLDLKGLLPEDQIQTLIETVVSRGGLVKDLHGEKNVYYQVNATYFSALGGDERKLLLARAIQMFMPGKPQVWYLDLFAGHNDLEAVRKGGSGGHKEINRTNLTWEEAEAALKLPVSQTQLALLRFRNTCPAFGFDAEFEAVESAPHILRWIWRRSGHVAELMADLRDFSFEVRAEGWPGEAISQTRDGRYRF